MRTSLIVLMIAVAVGLIAAAPVADAHSGSSDPHMWHHEGGMSPFFMLYDLDRLTQNLNLTPDQKAKVSDMQNAMKSNMSQMMTQHKTMQGMAQQELSTASPDFSKITSAMQNQIDANAQFNKDMLNKLNDFYNSLTLPQRTAFSKNLLPRFQPWDQEQSSQQ